MVTLFGFFEHEQIRIEFFFVGKGGAINPGELIIFFVGAPVCPRCGNLELYTLKGGKKFKCKAKGCYYSFTPTSGTIFASRKMAYVDLLAAICIIVNGAKGVSALHDNAT